MLLTPIIKKNILSLLFQKSLTFLCQICSSIKCKKKIVTILWFYSSIKCQKHGKFQSCITAVLNTKSMRSIKCQKTLLCCKNAVLIFKIHVVVTFLFQTIIHFQINLTFSKLHYSSFNCQKSGYISMLYCSSHKAKSVTFLCYISAETM